MIKINGNRIEPAEIEAAVKKVLGIDWAFAKGFVEPERSYIAVYYTAPIDIDYAHTREELMKILPTYMIFLRHVHPERLLTVGCRRCCLSEPTSPLQFLRYGWNE